MLSFLDGFRGVSLLNAVIKLLIAMVLGGVIGIERSYKNRPAGFRTHILVALGAAVASMTAIYMCLEADLPADISRIGAAVVSGLGFLGAGTIIVTKSYSVKGLTTAAGLWTSGIIGLAVGAGFYEGAIIAALLVLIAETTLGGIVNSIRRDPEFQIQVLFQQKTALDQVMRCSKNQRLSIINLHVVSTVYEDQNCYRAYVTLRPRTKVDKNRLYGEIKEINGIIDFSEVDMDDKESKLKG